MQRKFLVTGGAGFIGSHLIEKLLINGHQIVCVDDLSTGSEEYLINDDKLLFINDKIQNVDIPKLPKSINGIFHLAAQASVPLSIDEFYSSSSNNLLSTIRAFDLAKFYNVPIVYASSSAVYGNLPIGDDQKETFEILSPYAMDKLTIENYARMCWDIYKIPSIGMRFFNVYGPRQDPTNPYSGVISIFIDRILKNKTVTLNGGYQTRDFIFVEDIVKVMIVAIEYLFTNRLSYVFNVGTGVSVKIESLLKMLNDILKVETEVILKELPPGDPENSIGTYKHLTKVLKIDIDNFIELEEGLRNTIDYIRKYQEL